VGGLKLKIMEWFIITGFIGEVLFIIFPKEPNKLQQFLGWISITCSMIGVITGYYGIT
jgi:hypothetical protein